MMDGNIQESQVNLACDEYRRARLDLIAALSARTSRRSAYLEVFKRLDRYQAILPPGVLVADANPELADAVKAKLDEEREAHIEVERLRSSVFELLKTGLGVIGAHYGQQLMDPAYLHSNMDASTHECINNLWRQANEKRKTSLDGLSLNGLFPADPNGSMINAFAASAGFKKVDALLGWAEAKHLDVRDLVTLRFAASTGSLSLDTNTARSAARLESNGFIEPADDDRMIFGITHAGYKMAGMTAKQNASSSAIQSRKIRR